MNFFFQNSHRSSSINTILEDKKDREFLAYLLSTDTLKRQTYHNWTKPEEGKLLPILLENATEIDDEKFISSGLKASPYFYRVNFPNPNRNFISTFSTPLLKSLFEKTYLFPMSKELNTHWFYLVYFYPFDIEQVSELLDLPSKHLFFNIISPFEFLQLFDTIDEFIPSLGLKKPMY